MTEDGPAKIYSFSLQNPQQRCTALKNKVAHRLQTLSECNHSELKKKRLRQSVRELSQTSSEIEQNLYPTRLSLQQAEIQKIKWKINNIVQEQEQEYKRAKVVRTEYDKNKQEKWMNQLANCKQKQKLHILSFQKHKVFNLLDKYSWEEQGYKKKLALRKGDQNESNNKSRLNNEGQKFNSKNYNIYKVGILNWDSIQSIWKKKRQSQSSNFQI